MNNSKTILHIIQPGDTLYNIALKYNTSIQKIIDNNLAIDPYSLRVGQKLYIYPNSK